MPEIVLHFDADAQADLVAVVAALEAQGLKLDDVDSASAQADRSRMSAPEVLLVLTVATTILNNSATALDALQKTLHALKGVINECRLKNPRVEVGMSQVPAADLTEAQAKEALAPSH